MSSSTARSSSSSLSGASPASWFTPANLMMFTGVGHCAVGLAIPIFRTPFLSLCRGGYIGGLRNFAAVPTPLLYAQCNAFWFMGFGVAMGIVARTLQVYVRDVGALSRAAVTIPRSIAWSLIALGGLGALATPVSGFWLLVANGMWMLGWQSKPAGKALADSE
ncbi:hypothetical protein HDU88_005497 [Geranomyces variabilis]|nr:hypothetical protein HDU88_005497 [Geranomyces variabilis]